MLPILWNHFFTTLLSIILSFLTTFAANAPIGHSRQPFLYPCTVFKMRIWFLPSKARPLFALLFGLSLTFVETIKDCLPSYDKRLRFWNPARWCWWGNESHVIRANMLNIRPVYETAVSTRSFVVKRPYESYRAGPRINRHLSERGRDLLQLSTICILSTNHQFRAVWSWIHYSFLFFICVFPKDMETPNGNTC